MDNKFIKVRLSLSTTLVTSAVYLENDIRKCKENIKKHQDSDSEDKQECIDFWANQLQKSIDKLNEINFCKEHFTDILNALKRGNL